MNADDHYIVITADTHAGGSHAQYREFLDPKYRDDFDAWRGKYKNPFKDLKDTDLRIRNWDSELRDQQQHEDGIVGEVIFPNTVPPFFPNFVLFAQPPTPRRVRAPPRGHPGPQPLAGRLLRREARRAAPGSARSSSTTSTTRSPTCSGARRTACAAACSSVRHAVTCNWLKPLYDPDYDPLWAACEELGVPVNAHSGTGGPEYQPAPAMPLVHFIEMIFYSQRPFVYLIARRRVRAVPAPAVRDHRDRLCLDPARCSSSSTTCMVEHAPRRHG